MKQNTKIVMAVAIIAVVTAIVVGVGLCAWQKMERREIGKSNRFGITVNQLEMACKDSGGVFLDSKCECPGGTERDGSSTYTFQKETGNCVDPFGLPGGKLGKEIKQSHPLSQQ